MQQKQIKHHCEHHAFLHHRKKVLKEIWCTSVLKSRLHIHMVWTQECLEMHQLQVPCPIERIFPKWMKVNCSRFSNGQMMEILRLWGVEDI